MNSSQSKVSLPQHVQYFFKSWNTGWPLWKWHESSLFSSSINFLAHPWFTHFNFPLFDLNSFFSSPFFCFSSSSFFFFAYKSIVLGRCTCIVFVDIIYYDGRFLWFLYGRLSICYCIWFEELLLLFLFLVAVVSCCAGWQLLELIPIIHYLITACPSFLGVMEDRLARVISARSISILTFSVLFAATISFTFQSGFSWFSHWL